MHSDLERGVEDLVAAATSRSNSATGNAPAAAQGLKLDLKLLDGGSAVELTGDVVVTTDGMAVTPSGMGFTPNGDKIPGISPLGNAPATGDDDWFATYSAGQGNNGAAGGTRSSKDGPPSGKSLKAGDSGESASGRLVEEVAGLSPLLTPSNNKLCAALVDAF